MSSLNNSQIAKRYAQALFDVVPAEERTALSEEFQQVLVVLQDPQIKRTFTHPRTSTSRKADYEQKEIFHGKFPFAHSREEQRPILGPD